MKIKKFLNNLKTSLFIFQKKMFSINNFDNHLVIYFLTLRIRKKLKNKVQETNLSEFGLNQNPRDKKIILSLTTFPERINSVSKTIKTLLNQTLKPDRVLLWLAFEQFENKEKDLPKELLELQNFGLEIKWCNDIRSYKKLIPALKEFPNEIIITFDDDIYYPNNIVEKLYESYLKNPNCIHANRSRRFFVENDEIYSKTSAQNYWIKYDDCSYLNKLTGCGGVLYPPNSLDSRVMDENKFREIIPTQDDVWFWAMAVLAGTKIKNVMGYDIQLQTVENTQAFGLSKINSKKGKGIDSLDASRIMAKAYPELLEKLKEENNV